MNPRSLPSSLKRFRVDWIRPASGDNLPTLRIQWRTFDAEIFLLLPVALVVVGQGVVVLWPLVLHLLRHLGTVPGAALIVLLGAGLLLALYWLVATMVSPWSLEMAWVPPREQGDRHPYRNQGGELPKNAPGPVVLTVRRGSVPIFRSRTVHELPWVSKLSWKEPKPRRSYAVVAKTTGGTEMQVYRSGEAFEVRALSVLLASELAQIQQAIERKAGDSSTGRNGGSA